MFYFLSFNNHIAPFIVVNLITLDPMDYPG